MLQDSRPRSVRSRKTGSRRWRNSRRTGSRSRCVPPGGALCAVRRTSRWCRPPCSCRRAMQASMFAHDACGVVKSITTSTRRRFAAVSADAFGFSAAHSSAIAWRARVPLPRPESRSCRGQDEEIHGQTSDSCCAAEQRIAADEAALHSAMYGTQKSFTSPYAFFCTTCSELKNLLGLSARRSPTATRTLPGPHRRRTPCAGAAPLRDHVLPRSRMSC